MKATTPTHEGKHYTRHCAGRVWHFLALSTSEAYVYWRVIGEPEGPAFDVQTFTTSADTSTAYSQALGAWHRASGLVRQEGQGERHSSPQTRWTHSTGRNGIWHCIP